MSRYDFRALLADGYKFRDEWSPGTRLEYLADAIFDFTTYDGGIATEFAVRAIEVCAAISDRSTFDYISDPERYRWFLIMVNMPFFASRIEWGTSVRGAWWTHGEPIAYSSCGLFSGDEQITEFSLTSEEWLEFIAAIREFAAEEMAGTHA